MKSKAEVIELLEKLSTSVDSDVTIFVAGAAALLLTGLGQRATQDIDLVSWEGNAKKMYQGAERVAQDAKEGLRSNWINHDMKNLSARFLPPGWKERLVDIATMGKLHVKAISREDLILLKLIAGRPKDVADLKGMGLTLEDLNNARKSIPFVDRVDQGTAIFLEEMIDRIEGTIVSRKPRRAPKP